MKKIYILMVLAFLFIVCNIVTGNSFAGPVVPGDMRGAADAREEINRQLNSAAELSAAITGGSVAGYMTPAATPDKEIERRRKLINGAFNNFKALERSLTPEGGGADASAGSVRAGSSEEIAEALRNPPPRAIPVHGTVLIQGGEGSARSPGSDGKEVRYSVEERFVGNLVVAALEGKKAPKAEVTENEYQIDTISTAIKVRSLDGNVCLEKGRGGSDGACARSTNFVTSEVSSRERYPDFDSGVVSAEVDKGKVKIEVRAPDVLFKTGGGEATARLNCSQADFELTPAEFERLINSGELKLVKDLVSQGVGTKNSCKAGSTITLDLKFGARL